MYSLHGTRQTLTTFSLPSTLSRRLRLLNQAQPTTTVTKPLPSKFVGGPGFGQDLPLVVAFEGLASVAVGVARFRQVTPCSEGGVGAELTLVQLALLTSLYRRVISLRWCCPFLSLRVRSSRGMKSKFFPPGRSEARVWELRTIRL